MTAKQDLRDWLSEQDVFTDEELREFIDTAEDSGIRTYSVAQGLAVHQGWRKPKEAQVWSRMEDLPIGAPQGPIDPDAEDVPPPAPKETDPQVLQDARYDRLERELDAPPTQNPDAEKWYTILRSVGAPQRLARTVGIMLAQIPQDNAESIKAALGDVHLLTVNQRKSAFAFHMRVLGQPVNESEASNAPVSGKDKPQWGAVGGDVVQSATQGMTYEEADARASQQRRREEREYAPRGVQDSPLEVAKVIKEASPDLGEVASMINMGRDMADEGPPPPTPGMDPGAVTILNTVLANQAEENRAFREMNTSMMQQLREDKEARRHDEMMEMMRGMTQSMGTSKKSELAELMETVGTLGIDIPAMIQKFLNPQEKLTFMVDGVPVAMTPDQYNERYNNETKRSAVETVKSQVMPTLLTIFERFQAEKAEKAATASPEMARPMPPTGATLRPCPHCLAELIIPVGEFQGKCDACGEEFITPAGAEWMRRTRVLDEGPIEQEPAVPTVVERPPITFIEEVEEEEPADRIQEEAERVEPSPEPATAPV